MPTELSKARAVSEAHWLETSAEQSRRLLALIDAVKPGGRLLVQVIAAISGASFTDTDKRGLVDSLSSSAVAPKATKLQPQPFVDFPLFMTTEVWDLVLSPDADINAKGRAILSRLGRLGLKQVHEPAFATTAALLMIAQDGATKARSMSTQYVDDMYAQLKFCGRG